MDTLHPDLQRYRAELRDAIDADLEQRRFRRRIRTRAIRIGVPGFAVALGLTLTLVLAGSQAAFAGWSPSPTSASAGQASTADAACRAQLALTPASPGVAPGSGWNVVATDVRGPFTLMVFRNASGGATCLTGPSVTIVSRDGTNGRSMSVSQRGSSSGHGSRTSSVDGWSYLGGAGGAGSISHMILTHLASTSQGAFTVVEGQIDPGVTGVTLVLSDGDHVQATTGDGWFVAWWPRSTGADSAQITSSSRTSTQTFTLGATPTAPPPGGAANSGPSGNSGSGA